MISNSYSSISNKVLLYSGEILAYLVHETVQKLIMCVIEQSEFPELPSSPQEKTRPILSPKRDLRIEEVLKNGSEMLRQEANMNLQKYGSNYMPEF